MTKTRVIDGQTIHLIYGHRGVVGISDEKVSTIIRLGQKVLILVGRPEVGIQPNTYATVKALADPEQCRTGSEIITVEVAGNPDAHHFRFDEIGKIPLVAAASATDLELAAV